MQHVSIDFFQTKASLRRIRVNDYLHLSSEYESAYEYKSNSRKECILK